MKKIILLMALLILLVSCAEVQPDLSKCLIGDTYTFWGGLWHGFIVPFSFIGSIFSDEITIYALNNNGFWYNFGFFIGIGGLASSTKIKK